MDNYDDIWNRFIQEEEAAVDEIVQPGYLPEEQEQYQDDDEFNENQSEGGGSSLDEFDMFEEKELDLGVGYKQIQQLSYGDPEIGGRIGGGKMSKFERMIQQQSVSKEKLYMNRFRPVLLETFSMEKTNHFAKITESIPRFWLKNMELLAATFYMIDELTGDKLTANVLEKYSEKTHNKPVDMYRYYKMVVKHFKS